MSRPRTSLFLCALVAVALVISGCNIVNTGSNTVVGSENYITEERAVSGFSGVKLEGSGVVVIEKGDTESLTVETDDNIMPLVVTEVNDGVLRLAFKENTSVSTRRLTYRITALDVTSFEIFGSGAISMAQVDVPSVTVVVGGSGTVSLLGNATRQDIRIDGAGMFEGTNLDGDEAVVVIGGNGNASVNVSEKLDVNISGSGVVSYGGDPQVTQEISGSGAVVKR